MHLPSFAPGQYLTVRVPLGEDGDSRGADLYRVLGSGRSALPDQRQARTGGGRESAPGLMSNRLHDHLQTGDLIEAKAPRGQFALDAAETRPAVLLAGGVGITPMMSMLRHVVQEGVRTRNMRGRSC